MSSCERCIFARGCLAICIRTLDARGKMRSPNAPCKVKQFGDLRIQFRFIFLTLFAFRKLTNEGTDDLYITTVRRELVQIIHTDRDVYIRECVLE